MYRGPSAWLVWLNAAFCCVAFMPLTLLGLVWLTYRITGPGLAAMYSFAFFLGFCELSYLAIIPTLIAALFMVASSRIPPRVMAVTIAAEFVALAQLVWLLHVARIGLFGKP